MFPELKATRITEVVILVFLLLLWCLAVALFFKRWGQTFLRSGQQWNEIMFSGKIRNLIPYQPYQQPVYMTEISQQIERIHSENKTKISSGELCYRCKFNVRVIHSISYSLQSPDIK